MKEKFINFQGKLMDVVIVSAISLLGLVTIVGFFYGIAASFVYLQEKSHEKWTVIKNFKTFGISVLLEVSAIFWGIIIYLDVMFLYNMKGWMVILMSFMLSLYLFILPPLYLIILYHLSKYGNLTRKSFINSFKAYFLNVPSWFLNVILLIVLSIVTYLFPAISILTVGLFIIMTNYVIGKQKQVN